MYKRGITLSSIVIYVIFFFGFTVFAASIGSNLNRQTISQKGEIWINEEYLKLEYNLFKSAKDSQSVENISNNIVFSNGDEYKFNLDKRTIYKNGGALITEVDDFEIINSTDIANTNIDNSSKYIECKISLSKYKRNLNKNIFVTVGEVMNLE